MESGKTESLREPYRSRISFMAQAYPATVSLKVRHGSGKTLVLEVTAPGVKPRCVLRLHRREHKVFYALVKSAQEWLKGYKALYAPVETPLILLPANVSSTAGLLIPQDTLYGYEKRAVHGELVSSNWYKGKDIYGPELRKLAQELAQERAHL